MRNIQHHVGIVWAAHLKRFIFAKVEIWIILVCLILFMPALSMFGWLVQYKAEGGKNGGAFVEFAYNIASFPNLVLKLLGGESAIQPQILRFDAFSGLHRHRSHFEEQGTLLVSSYNDQHGVSTAFLYDLRSEKILHEWVPPVAVINKVAPDADEHNLRRNYRTQHPMLLESGDILFTSGQGPLVRIDACGHLVWAINRQFHHSIERGTDGYFYVPIVIAPPEDSASASSGGPTGMKFRNDGFAKISLDGKILKEWSVRDILERHGYATWLYGIGPFEEDRIHLNDAEPIRISDEYVQEGDVVLSIRNLSTVLLYRPAEDEIVWLQTGPWLNQHDVDYQGNGRFTVFGNDMVRTDTEVSRRGYSTIWQYDQKTGETTPFLPLKHVDIYSVTQGLHRLLENGDVFVEEQEEGKLHRVAPDGLVWSYVHGLGSGRIGALHWSRYLTEQEARFPWLESLKCE